MKNLSKYLIWKEGVNLLEINVAQIFCVFFKIINILNFFY